MGYHRAGFEVVGVDIDSQPNYPFEFIQGDALSFPIKGFDVVHASPPCQAFTAYKRTGNVAEDHPDLIAPTRERLEASGLPFVIENVEGAPLRNPVMLCGSAFGLDVRRHRLFEASFDFMAPGCVHGRQAPNRFPGGRSKERTGSSRGLCRATVEIGAWDIPLDIQQRAIGIDWMPLEDLTESIPPAFTEYIGAAILGRIS